METKPWECEHVWDPAKPWCLKCKRPNITGEKMSLICDEDPPELVLGIILVVITIVIFTIL